MSDEYTTIQDTRRGALASVEVVRPPERLSPEEARSYASRLIDAADQIDATLERRAADTDYMPLFDPDTGIITIVNLPELAADVANARVQVHGAPATAVQLFTNGNLGVDLLYAEPWGNFPLHVHPGDHLLYIVAGTGTITFGGIEHATGPGDLYMVQGMVEHAVGAGAEGQWIAAFGSPHKRADSHERMTPIPEEATTNSLQPVEAHRKVAAGHRHDAFGDAGHGI